MSVHRHYFKASRCLLILLFLGTAYHAVAVNDPQPLPLPEVELMPELKGYWVARRMVMNGLPASIRVIRGAINPETVIAHYERSWRHDKHTTLKRREGQWYVISARRSDQFVTLQIRAAGAGSEGLIMVSADPADYTPRFDTAFPLPQSVVVIGRQTYVDGDVEAESITLRSPRSLSSETLAFKDLLAREGWLVTIDRAASSTTGGHMMEFQKGSQHAQIFLARNPAGGGETLMLITWRR